MTRNTANNTNESTEQVKKVAPRNLVREFVSPFVETRLAEKNGGTFYSEAKASKGDVKADFLAYWKNKDEWNNLSKQEKETAEAFEKSLFLKEIVRTGAGLESKRDTLIKILDREFTLDAHQKQALSTEIKSFSYSELTRYLNFRTTRTDFMNRTFPKKETKPPELDFGKQFEKVFEKNNVTLSEDQKQGVARLLSSSHVSEADIEAVLPFFRKLDEKQLLVKFFLPTITLAELEEMGILSKQQVHAYIRKCVDSEIIGQDFSIEDDLIDSVDPNDIILPTSLMPETDLDRLLAGKGKRAIVKQIEETNQEHLKEFENNNSLGLTPDEDGHLLPAFHEKLRALGIVHPENFNVGSYVRGKIKQADGTVHAFHFVITGIDDDPVKNRADNGNRKQVTIKNVLTGDGSSIDKNWSNKAGESYSYSDLHQLFTKAKKSKGLPEISTQEMIEAQVNKGEIKEKILREDIDSLSALNNALDSIDPDGKKHPLQKTGGASIQVGEPGKDDFWVFQVKSVNEEKKTIAIMDGGSQEILSFQQFFDTFESREGKRLQKIEGPEDFLSAIQANSPKAKDFGGIVYNKDRGIFMPENRKDDKNFPGILQFAGEKNTITLHQNNSSGLVGWTDGEWEAATKADEQKKIKAKPGKYKPDAKNWKGGWNALYAQFMKLRTSPVIPDVPLTAPDQKTEKKDFHEKHGHLKHYMGNPSLHDMFTGAKDLIGFIKHKLEHGAKGHAAKFQLALGKKLGFNDEMMRELRAKVHGKTKELMEEMIKDLSGLPSGERQTEVKHILENHGSHDYEIQAAILAMLKKHGNLYVGKTLRGLEGSFIFFERLSGTKYGPENPHVQRALKACKEKGILFREEFLIENYLQFIGGKDGGYQVDWNLWLDVKRGWAEGMKAESESGETQAGTFGTMEGRLNWVYEKFEGGEYSNGIGAMKKVWSKGGPPHKMHEPAIYLALSNISSRLHGSQLDALKNEFYGGGHPYPALTALFTPEKLATFQKTVKILCESDSAMKTAYEKIEKARSANVGDAMSAIRQFWTLYGPDLHKKLLISQDPEVLYRSQYDTNPEVQKTLTDYVANYKGDTENLGKFNEDELTEGTYTYEHSGYTWSPDAYLKQIKINEGPGAFNSNDLSTKIAWEGYLQSLKQIKHIHMTDDEAKNRAFQFSRFKEQHKAFYKTILPKLSPGGFKDLEKQTYMTELGRYGFSIPPWRDKDKLESEEYDKIVKKDFQDYLSGGKKTTSDEKETVATSISSLLDRPAANDVQVRQRA